MADVSDVTVVELGVATVGGRTGAATPAAGPASGVTVGVSVLGTDSDELVGLVASMFSNPIRSTNKSLVCSIDDLQPMSKTLFCLCF